jgi:choline dehydrogenase-like flavoprotein
MRTAKMGDDPERSVVDSNCQAHDVDNLFVIDGSVFVTSGVVNPTSTIQAIALRTADYICNERTDLKG